MLLPVASIAGGFSLAPGPIGARQPPPGAFVTLLSPVAAAARGGDVYLADAGLNGVFHYDMAAQTLRRLPGMPGRIGIRLCVMPDAGVLVLDPLLRRLVRYSRDGARLSELRDQTLIAGATDLAIEDASGMAWLADGARVIGVRPALNAIFQVPMIAPPGEPLGQFVALAAHGDALYALDAARGRVLSIDPQGRILQVFGEGTLRMPHAIAVDRRRRVFIADRFDQTLHVFRDGRPLAVITAAALGVLEICDLRVHDDDLAIADSLAARVHLFRLLADRAGP